MSQWAQVLWWHPVEDLSVSHKASSWSKTFTGWSLFLISQKEYWCAKLNLEAKTEQNIWDVWHRGVKTNAVFIRSVINDSLTSVKHYFITVRLTFKPFFSSNRNHGGELEAQHRDGFLIVLSFNIFGPLFVWWGTVEFCRRGVFKLCFLSSLS